MGLLKRMHGLCLKWKLLVNFVGSSHIRGFSIQIGHDQTGLRFTEYYMDLRDLAGKRCLIGELQVLSVICLISAICLSVFTSRINF